MGSQGQLNYYDKPLGSHRDFVPEYAQPLTEIPRGGPRYIMAVLPIRLMIFILTLLYIAALIYLIYFRKPELDASYPLILMSIASLFLFCSVFNIIGYFGDFEVLEVLMIFISFLGIGCFVFLGDTSMYGAPSDTFTRIMTIVICYATAALYTVDVLLAVVYWRLKYTNNKKLGKIGRVHSILDYNAYTETLPPYREVF